MGFSFKRKESVSRAVRRLGRERIEHALACLKDCEHAAAIHCVRKDIKKVRATLRLVAAGIAKKQFSRLTKLLRKAAKCLSAARDAFIKAETLHNLAGHFKGQLAPAALRHVRAELRSGFEVELKRFGKEKTARTVERTLSRVAKELKRLELSSKGWNALSRGVKDAYSTGRCAYETVLSDSSPENYHQWRKCAKDLWYQVTLLHRIWPEQMEAMASELKSLGSLLGDDHDLVVLREAVEEHIEDVHARELETLHGLIEERQRELRATALALGARFYAEKPSVFCNRLAGYWQIWRREKKSASPAQ